MVNDAVFMGRQPSDCSKKFLVYEGVITPVFLCLIQGMIRVADHIFNGFILLRVDHFCNADA